MKQKKFLLTGDKHGSIDFLNNLNQCNPQDVGIIILGNTGIDFWLSYADKKKKQALQDSGFTFYLIRGNHEQRPELLSGIEIINNEDINGYVYKMPEYPNINYLMNGHIYMFGTYSAYIINGAYSIDKYQRLKTGRVSEDDPEDKIIKNAGWFPKEQLTAQEMGQTADYIKGRKVNFVFSHTCPYSWQPTDLFLNGIGEVDNTMEKWMDEIKDTFTWDAWCFGHFHDDRLVRPHVEMFYNDIEKLDTIWNRYYNKKTIRTSWWLKKDPHYYWDDNPYWKEGV